MHYFVKLIYLPVAVFYALALRIRNLLYDEKFILSYHPALKTICIGNISLGGTGKTPHTEYLANYFHKRINNVAILSRGYGRNTTGFFEVSQNDSPEIVGDEPLQMKTNFQNLVRCFVCENRMLGIEKIQKKYPETDLILLDDAFQHRAVKCGYNIVLTDCEHLFYNDYVLPIGTLRDEKRSLKRADLVIVTKYKSNFEKEKIIQSIKKYTNAEIVFSTLKYSNEITHFTTLQRINFSKLTNLKTIVITGISKPEPLLQFLESHTFLLKHFEFPDHHFFTTSDLNDIQSFYQNVSDNTILLTTQKDAMRLNTSFAKEVIGNLPLYYLPIEISFDENDELLLAKLLDNYVREN